ncbi:MAG TPA: paraquat-inducible protein A [Burkholderiales bacterium]|nr:paraquat-inducible protein A [Burkholderiales bacterium]
MNRAQLLACPECDLLQHDARSPRPRKALCARCGAVLYQRRGGGLERSLALTVTALVLLALANAFPILTLELQGERTTATLAGAAAALWSQDMPLVAILVLFMAVVMPLAELAALAWLLVPLRRGVRAPGFGAVFRVLQFASRWGAVEVLVLGTLVSLVKLGHVADVEPGIALGSYGALMLVMAAIEASFDPRELWARVSPA